MIGRVAILMLCLLAACGGSVDATVDTDRVRIRGTVLRAANGEAVEGAEIVGPGDVRARSGPNGEFLLSGLERGASGEVRAEHESGLAATLSIRPLQDDELVVVLHLRRP